jgi:hypothetical protein
MLNILEEVEKSRARVVPETVNQFFGLQIARELSEEKNARAYLGLSDRHSISSLLRAFKVAKSAEQKTDALISHLKIAHPGSDQILPALPLLAIRVSRRAIAAAVFVRLDLQRAVVRELPSKSALADLRAEVFMRSLLESFPESLVALEALPEAQETRQRALSLRVTQVVREEAVPLTELQPQEVLEAFSIPSGRNRAQVRAVLERIFPELPERFPNRAILDACALGLLVQSTRLIAGSEAPA